MMGIIKNFDEFKKTNEIFSSISSGIGKGFGKISNIIKGRSNNAFSESSDDQTMGKKILSSIRNISNNSKNILKRIFNPSKNWYYFFTEIDSKYYKIDAIKHTDNKTNKNEEYTIGITELNKIEDIEKYIDSEEIKNKNKINTSSKSKKKNKGDSKSKSLIILNIDKIIDITEKKEPKIQEIKYLLSILNASIEDYDVDISDDIREEIENYIQKLIKIEKVLTNDSYTENEKSNALSSAKRLLEKINKLAQSIKKQENVFLLNQKNESVLFFEKFILNKIDRKRPTDRIIKEIPSSSNNYYKLKLTQKLSKVIFDKLEELYETENPNY